MHHRSLVTERSSVCRFLTKATVATESLQTFLHQGLLSLVPTRRQVEEEAYRLTLRRGQRQRAKDRKEARKSSQVCKQP